MDNKINQNLNSSPFDLQHQQNEIESKMVVGLERIAEVFRFLLWERAKMLGLSPIQIQILIFLKHHTPEKAKVSYLSKEFNLSKPTISDSILTLEKKNLIQKVLDPTDTRSFTINLTDKGEKIVLETEDFANPLKSIFTEFSNEEKVFFWSILSKTIFKLNTNGIIPIQRMCFNCKFYEERPGEAHCLLLNKKLRTKDIRIDCPEFIDVSDSTLNM